MKGTNKKLILNIILIMVLILGSNFLYVISETSSTVKNSLDQDTMSKESFSKVYSSHFPIFEFNNSIILIDLNQPGNSWEDVASIKGNGTKNNPFVLENLMLDGQNEKNGIVIINSNEFYAEIRNCTIINVQTLIEGIGIRLENCSNIIIDNCHLTNATIGIQLIQSEFLIIRNNFISDTVYAIQAIETDDFYLKENDLISNENGIHIEDGNNFFILNNVLERNLFCALNIERSSQCEVNFNLISFNEQGILLNEVIDSEIYQNICDDNEISGIRLGSCEFLTLFGNNCSSNENSGIFLGSSTSIVLILNFVNHNEIGIDIYSAINISISENQIKENKNGIRLWSSEQINIQRNYISYNQIGILYSQISELTQENNTFTNNDVNLKEDVPSLTWLSILISGGIAMVIMFIILSIRKKNRFYTKLET